VTRPPSVVNRASSESEHSRTEQTHKCDERSMIGIQILGVKLVRFNG
jgi:hypothetical protein